MLHLSDKFEVTYCGQKVTDEMDVTDAVVEVAADPIEHDGCPKCCKAAEKLIEADEAAWKHERAIEAGMLHGATAYNEEMGW